jgi:hypothetical protein
MQTFEEKWADFVAAGATHVPPPATGAELQKTIAQRRELVAEGIRQNPELFCVCEICNGIMRLPIKDVCRSCKGYRFDYSREGVLAMVEISGAKALATGCPVLPRFAARLNEA